MTLKCDKETQRQVHVIDECYLSGIHIFTRINAIISSHVELLCYGILGHKRMSLTCPLIASYYVKKVAQNSNLQGLHTDIIIVCHDAFEIKVIGNVSTPRFLFYRIEDFEKN